MRMYDMAFLLITLGFVIGLPFSSVAQDEKFLGKNEVKMLGEGKWYEGSVLLKDDTELVGMVKFNHKDGILAFQDAKQDLVFRARRVMAFEFFDEALGTHRLFFAMPYHEETYDRETEFFFELLKDFHSFSVVIRTDPVEINYQTGPKVLDNVYSKNYLEISQTETVFFLTPDGALNPYISFTHLADGFGGVFSTSRTTKNGKYEDRDLFEEYIGEEAFEQLKAYASENDLKFKRKEDFLKLLDYCVHLLKP